jgi:predicted GNAT superfamily acetyltransferase
MHDPGLEIRTLETPDDMASIATMFQQVWGSVEPIVGVELLRALAYSGGYVAGAFVSDHLIGASFGFLGKHDGQDALHSHVTGILPGVQHSGVGRAVKDHQREWAAHRNIPWITWTFDPLVRRNAWFNLEVLKAQVADYLVNFYGQMNDSINTDEESDRLVIAWSTDSSEEPSRPVPSGPGRVVYVPTPDDIVVLRRTDPAAAAEWRVRVRAELGDRLAAGAVVTKFTRDGNYVLHVPDGVE